MGYGRWANGHLCPCSFALANNNAESSALNDVRAFLHSLFPLFLSFLPSCYPHPSPASSIMFAFRVPIHGRQTHSPTHVCTQVQGARATEARQSALQGITIENCWAEFTPESEKVEQVGGAQGCNSMELFHPQNWPQFQPKTRQDAI